MRMMRPSFSPMGRVVLFGSFGLEGSGARLDRLVHLVGGCLPFLAKVGDLVQRDQNVRTTAEPLGDTGSEGHVDRVPSLRVVLVGAVVLDVVRGLEGSRALGGVRGVGAEVVTFAEVPRCLSVQQSRLISVGCDGDQLNDVGLRRPVILLRVALQEQLVGLVGHDARK